MHEMFIRNLKLLLVIRLWTYVCGVEMQVIL
jgi:hypothetical protein